MDNSLLIVSICMEETIRMKRVKVKKVQQTISADNVFSSGFIQAGLSKIQGLFKDF